MRGTPKLHGPPSYLVHKVLLALKQLTVTSSAGSS